MLIGIPIAPRPLHELCDRHGGLVRNGAQSPDPRTGESVVRRLAPIGRAAAGELTPLFALRYLDDARRALARGALLLIDESVAVRGDIASLPGWFHPHAAWALAELLESADVPTDDPVIGPGCTIAPGAILLPRVRLGARVTVGPGAVVGGPGFGFAAGADGKTRSIPHLGGVYVEDDVFIGALSTIACGTLGPTILRRGVKLDAQVHIGHNCEIGEGTVIAAQSGIAGSVVVGRGVLMGGQVGIADHLRIGDGARIAAKSGVIGDVAPGATVAGYPAVERTRWLRGLAELYRIAASRGVADPSPGAVPTSPVPLRGESPVAGASSPIPLRNERPAFDASSTSTVPATSSSSPAPAPLAVAKTPSLPPGLNPAAIIRGSLTPRKEGSG